MIKSAWAVFKGKKCLGVYLKEEDAESWFMSFPLEERDNLIIAYKIDDDPRGVWRFDRRF